MNTVSEHLKKTAAASLVDSSFDALSNQEVVHILPDQIRTVCNILKTELGFDMLIDLFTIDWLGKHPKRFEMCYLFINMKNQYRLQVRVALDNDDKPTIDSITDIYGAANWAERECYDMYGIHVNNHPNLSRLLMWEEFEGHPQRKDYPVNKRQPIPVLQKLL